MSSPEDDPRDALLDACAAGELGRTCSALPEHPGLSEWPALAALAHALPHSTAAKPVKLLAHTAHALTLAEGDPSAKELAESSRELVRLGLLFHDVGHVDARRAPLVDRTGGCTAHDARGSVRTRYLLHHTKRSHEQRRAIATLVALHRAPGTLAATLDQQEPARARSFLERIATQCSVSALYALARCDALALDETRSEAALEAAEYLRIGADEHEVFDEPPRPWLTEADPEVKRIRFESERARTYALAEAHRRRLVGEFTAREQAIAFCYSRASHKPADVVVTVGIAGSGKSTALETYAPSHERLSPDDERESRYGDAAEQGNPGEIHAACIAQLKSALRRGARIAYDATNVRPELRAKVLRVCHDYGARVALWCFDTPLDVAMKRNRKRERVVPEAVVLRQAGQFSWPRPWEAHEIRVFDEPAGDDS